VITSRGETREIFRHADYRTTVDPWVDYLNSLFRLSSIPIRADIVDVVKFGKRIDSNSLDADFFKAMTRDNVLQTLRLRNNADEVIVVTNRSTYKCGLHEPGKPGYFNRNGWIVWSSIGCDLWSATGKRTFAHEIAHGMGLSHSAAEAVMKELPSYASPGLTKTWGTIMDNQKLFGWTLKDTFSDQNRKCDKSTNCGGNNKADAARYLRESLFKYTPIPAYQFKNKTNGQCLDIRDGAHVNNVLMTKPCNGSGSQKFRWISGGSINVEGLCLEVGSGKDADKALVHLKPCDGSNKQRWVDAGNGLIKSRNGTGTRCLDLATESNNWVLMHTCWPSSTDQQFTWNTGQKSALEGLFEAKR
jgi:hypothetical protein